MIIQYTCYMLNHKMAEQMYKDKEGGDQAQGEADQKKKKEDDDVIDAEIE